MLKRYKSQAGDTIVEVLICILVISSVLAGAFTVTNQSLMSVRASQERAQAVKLVQTQIEQLRTLGGLPSGNEFCVQPSGVAVNNSDLKDCYFDQAGGYVSDPGTKATSGDIQDLYSSDSGVEYKIFITKPAVNSTTYELTAKWVTVKGNLGKITMYYSVDL